MCIFDATRQTLNSVIGGRMTGGKNPQKNADFCWEEHANICNTLLHHLFGDYLVVSFSDASESAKKHVTYRFISYISISHKCSSFWGWGWGQLLGVPSRF